MIMGSELALRVVLVLMAASGGLALAYLVSHGWDWWHDTRRHTRRWLGNGRNSGNKEVN